MDPTKTSSSAATVLPPHKDYTHYKCAPLYTGIFGGSLGTAYGALRGQSSLLYALHLGIGYGIFGGTFSSVLYALENVRGVEDRYNWIGAGAVSGAVTSLITAGPKKVVSGAVFFGGIGLIAESIGSLIGESLDNYTEKRAKDRLLGETEKK